ELDRRANRLAHRLIARGARPDHLIAICLDPSVDLIVGLMAIWKAGCAYVPLDPSYPKDRLSFIGQDAGARLILTQPSLSAELPFTAEAIVLVGGRDEILDGSADRSPRIRMSPDGLANVLYTSGSTGQPKGVMGTHRGIINRFEWMWRV